MKTLSLALLVVLVIGCKAQEKVKPDPNAQQVTYDPITGRTVVTGGFDVPIKINEDQFTVLKDTERTLTHEGRNCKYPIKKGTSTFDVANDQLIFSNGTTLQLISATTRGTIYGSWKLPSFEEDGWTKSYRYTFKQKVVNKQTVDIMSVKMACSY